MHGCSSLFSLFFSFVENSMLKLRYEGLSISFPEFEEVRSAGYEDMNEPSCCGLNGLEQHDKSAYTRKDHQVV